MNIKKFAKQATVLTFTTALLAGGQLKRLRKKRTKSHIRKHTAFPILHAMICCKSLNSKKMKNIKFLNSIRPQLKISLLQRPGRLGQLGHYKR